MSHGLAKKCRTLPGSGWRAPRWRLRNLLVPASTGLVLLTPSMTLTNACVSRLNRSGPVGDAAMFGRYAWSPRMTMLWSWFGKARVSGAGGLVRPGNVNPVICGANFTVRATWKFQAEPAVLMLRTATRPSLPRSSPWRPPVLVKERNRVTYNLVLSAVTARPRG